MSRNNVLEKIVIIDFGSQFTQLIARKVREIGVYSEIINFNQIKSLKKNSSIKGIILSGGPLTTTNKNSIDLDNCIIDLKLPGGGGHGDPLKRSRKLIDDDFKKGYCTKKYITKNYK